MALIPIVYPGKPFMEEVLHCSDPSRWLCAPPMTVRLCIAKGIFERYESIKVLRVSAMVGSYHSSLVGLLQALVIDKHFKN